MTKSAQPLRTSYAGSMIAHTIAAAATPRFLASRVSPLIAACKKLRIGWEGDVLGLHGGIDRDPLRPQRPALARHPLALGQEKFQLAAEALAPMAQVRAARAETRAARTFLR